MKKIIVIALFLALLVWAWRVAGPKPIPAVLPVQVAEGVTPEAPRVPGALETQLKELRQTYQTDETSPARIRLQATLDRLWEGSMPADLALAEIRNQSAPEGYRLHFANRLRQAVKTTASSEAATIGAELRYVLESQGEPEIFRARLAQRVIDIDPSEATMMAISKQLNRTQDDAAAALLAGALARSTHPQAKRALQQFAQSAASRPTQLPNALETALATLSHDAELPLAELRKRLGLAPNDAK